MLVAAEYRQVQVAAEYRQAWTAEASNTAVSQKVLAALVYQDAWILVVLFYTCI